MLSYFTDIKWKILCRIILLLRWRCFCGEKRAQRSITFWPVKWKTEAGAVHRAAPTSVLSRFISWAIFFSMTHKTPLAARHSGGQIFRLYNYGKNSSARGHTKADRRGWKQYVPPKSERIPPSRSRKTMRHSRSGKTTYPPRNKTITRLT